MNDKLNEAIEKVKHLKRFLMVYEDIHQVTLMTGSDKEAIYTVVSALEKPLPTDEQIEKNGIEGGLRDGELQMFWEGATWMRDLMRG